MVDARLPGNWLNEVRFMDLSDKAWRIFTGALMWSNEQGTDGRIPARYVRYLHPDDVDDADLGPLIAAGLFVRTEAGIEMPGWGDGLRQSTAEAVENYRKNARERQQKRRNSMKLAAGTDLESQSARSHVVTRDVTGDIPRDVGKGISSSSEEQASAYVQRDVTRDTHEHEPEAVRALTTIHADCKLPLQVDELLQNAYRIGQGDPWAGYLAMKPQLELAIVDAKSPAAVLRYRLREIKARKTFTIPKSDEWMYR